MNETREHAQQYTKPGDAYAHARCVNCSHLRYADEKPGAPCRWCPCTDHRLPNEAVSSDGPSAPEAA